MGSRLSRSAGFTFTSTSGAIPFPSRQVPSGRRSIQEGTKTVTPFGSSWGFGLPLEPHVVFPTVVQSGACSIMRTNDSQLLMT